MHPLLGGTKRSLASERSRSYQRCGKVGKGIGFKVNYYAHTAARSDGLPDPNPAKWQLLSMHLRNVCL